MIKMIKATAFIATVFLSVGMLLPCIADGTHLFTSSVVNRNGQSIGIAPQSRLVESEWEHESSNPKLSPFRAVRLASEAMIAATSTSPEDWKLESVALRTTECSKPEQWIYIVTFGDIVNIETGPGNHYVIGVALNEEVFLPISVEDGVVVEDLESVK